MRKQYTSMLQKMEKIGSNLSGMTQESAAVREAMEAGVVVSDDLLGTLRANISSLNEQVDTSSSAISKIQMHITELDVVNRTEELNSLKRAADSAKKAQAEARRLSRVSDEARKNEKKMREQLTQMRREKAVMKRRLNSAEEKVTRTFRMRRAEAEAARAAELARQEAIEAAAHDEIRRKSDQIQALAEQVNQLKQREEQRERAVVDAEQRYRTYVDETKQLITGLKQSRDAERVFDKAILASPPAWKLEQEQARQLLMEEQIQQEEDEDRRFAEEEAEFELAESAATDDFFGEGIAWKPGSTVETSVDRRIRKAREERRAGKPLISPRLLDMTGGTAVFQPNTSLDRPETSDSYLDDSHQEDGEEYAPAADGVPFRNMEARRMEKEQEKLGAMRQELQAELNAETEALEARHVTASAVSAQLEAGEFLMSSAELDLNASYRSTLSEEEGMLMTPRADAGETLARRNIGSPVRTPATIRQQRAAFRGSEARFEVRPSSEVPSLAELRRQMSHIDANGNVRAIPDASAIEAEEQELIAELSQRSLGLRSEGDAGDQSPRVQDLAGVADRERREQQLREQEAKQLAQEAARQRAEQEVRESAAATRLQAMQRGSIGRKQANQRMENIQKRKLEQEQRAQELQEQEQAALRIQARQRGKQTRRKEGARKEQRRQNDAAVKIQNVRRGAVARQQAAAKRAQRTADRERVQLAEARGQEAAARRIQQAQRHKTQQQEELRQKLAEAEQQASAATMIQKQHRAKAARRELAGKKAEHKAQSSAAGSIQAAHRGRVARRELNEQRQAAIKIQALQRGKQARRERDEQDRAAGKMQAIQRGRQGRREAERRRQAAAPAPTPEAEQAGGGMAGYVDDSESSSEESYGDEEFSDFGSADSDDQLAGREEEAPAAAQAQAKPPAADYDIIRHPHSESSARALEKPAAAARSSSPAEYSDDDDFEDGFESDDSIARVEALAAYKKTKPKAQPQPEAARTVRVDSVASPAKSVPLTPDPRVEAAQDAHYQKVMASDGADAEDDDDSVDELDDELFDEAIEMFDGDLDKASAFLKEQMELRKARKRVEALEGEAGGGGSTGGGSRPFDKGSNVMSPPASRGPARLAPTAFARGANTRTPSPDFLGKT